MRDTDVLQLVLFIGVGLLLMAEFDLPFLGLGWCQACYSVARIVVVPAFLFAWTFGGDHSVREAAYVGAAFEFALLWALWFDAWRTYRRRRAISTPESSADPDA